MLGEKSSAAHTEMHKELMRQRERSEVMSADPLELLRNQELKERDRFQQNHEAMRFHQDV